MRLADIYYKRHYRHKPKTFFDNLKYKNEEPSKEEIWQFKPLTGLHIPSGAQIAHKQKEAAKVFFTNTWGEKYLKRLNQDIIEPLKTINYQQEISEWIDKLQQSLGTRSEKDSSGDIVNYALGWLTPENQSNSAKLTATFRKNETALRYTLDNLQSIYNLFQQKKASGIIPFPKKVLTQLSNLNNIITQLQTDLQGIKNNPNYQIDIVSRSVSGDGKMGYLAWTGSVANELQGFLLPLIFIEKTKELAAQSGKRFIDTGAWTNKQGQELPVDLVYGTVGKNTVFDNMIENFDKLGKTSQAWSMTIEDYNDTFGELKKGVFGLIQAKSNRFTPAPTNLKLSAQQVIDKNDNRISGALRRLIQLKKFHNARILASHEQYNALFNYELHRFMQSIIGVENNIILTPKGIWTIGDWINETFDGHYYFQAYYNISLNKPDAEHAIVAKPI